MRKIRSLGLFLFPVLTCWISLAGSISAAKAQIPIFLKGRVVDSSGLTAPFALVSLREDKRFLASSVCDSSGHFTIKTKISRAGAFQLTALYQTRKSNPLILILPLEPEPGETELLLIIESKSFTLPDVVIRSKHTGISVNGDTVEYEANRYSSPDARKIEDLLAKMEGFKIGPDGRITYNGALITNLLLEGDDLTAENYQLLSRNLAAGLVNKVQVIHHYQSSPIMAGVARSDDLAVNLTVRPEHSGRLNAQISLAGSVEGRYSSDLGLHKIATGMKFLNFANLNNIGNASGVSLQPGNATSENTKETAGNSDFPSFPHHSQVTAPLELGQYTNNNHDLGLLSMLHGRTHGGDQINVRLGVEEVRSRLSQQISSFYRLSDRDGWDTWSIATLSTSRLRWFGQLEYMSLDSGRREQRAKVDYATGRQQSIYKNLVTGAITDLYNERMHLPYQAIRVSYEEIDAWKRGRVFAWNSTLSFNRADPDTDLASGRFNDYFQLDPGEHRLRQDMQFNRLFFQSKADLYHRTSKTDLRLGIRITHQSQRIRAGLFEEQNAGGISDTVSTSETKLFRSMVSLAGSAEYNLNKQLRVALSGSSSLIFHPVSAGTRISAGYRVLFAAIRTLSIFKWVSISADLSRSLPDPAEIFDGPLISGNYSILYGLDRARPVNQLVFSGAYLDANVFRGRSLNLLFNFSMTNRGLTSMIDLEPDVGVSFSLQQFRSVRGNFSFSYERHIEVLKGKFTARLAGHVDETPLVLNTAPTTTTAYSHAEEIIYQPDLQKLNVELTGRLDHYYTILERSGEDLIHHTNYRVSTHARLRAKFSQRFRGLMEYHFYRMAPGAYFYPVDLSLFLRITQRLQSSFVVHNLMNRKSIVATQISGYSRMVSGYGIIPRYFMFGISFDL